MDLTRLYMGHRHLLLCRTAIYDACGYSEEVALTDIIAFMGMPGSSARICPGSPPGALAALAALAPEPPFKSSLAHRKTPAIRLGF